MPDHHPADAPEPISARSAAHYRWGHATAAADGAAPAPPCDGWHLVRAPELAVIEERMPPATHEARHRHARARQFFYVLDGELTLEVEGTAFALARGDGLEIAPGVAHQARNDGSAATRFLVVSQPPSHGDRLDAPVDDRRRDAGA